MNNHTHLSNHASFTNIFTILRFLIYTKNNLWTLSVNVYSVLCYSASKFIHLNILIKKIDKKNSNSSLVCLNFIYIIFSNWKKLFTYQVIYQIQHKIAMLSNRNDSSSFSEHVNISPTKCNPSSHQHSYVLESLDLGIQMCGTHESNHDFRDIQSSNLVQWRQVGH